MSRPAVSGISAVLPAFNEAPNLERAVGAVAAALQKWAPSFEIVVVDDGSRDETPAVLDRLRTEHRTLRIVRHAENRGYGAAVRAGFHAARLPWVFLIDADNQFDPEDVRLLLEHAGNADIVAGYRRQRRDPVLRRLNAWAFFTLARALLGPLARDVNCAFKLIRRDLLQRMTLHADGALINTEVLVLARRLQARIVEVPVQHFPRTAGKPTGSNPRVILRAFAELFDFRAEVNRDQLRKAA
jgi:glycosyltransferase involved in cell wall biosynthesis